MTSLDASADSVESPATSAEPGNRFRTPGHAPVAVPLPEPGWRYRLKLKVLGQPLHTEALEHETLGKPTALAVFASDNLSSAAYATEEILHVLVPVIGVAAFSLVMPVTIALLIVLGFLILSYRQTIEAYPKSASAYLVVKDNFGLHPALIAAVSLLTDYILTVAVSVAAGTAALASAFPALSPYRVPISLAFIGIIALGNLRGLKESGKVFAVPTYFFLLNIGVLLAVGLARTLFGHLPVADPRAEGLVELGAPGSGLLYGAAFFVVLRAFASGGAAVTGVEAISDGVPAFRPPAWRNARATLVVMGSLLAIMFFGISGLAAKMHVIPFHDGTPTVMSEIGNLVYGESALGSVLHLLLNASTMLILVLAANTSFADFPRLANFAAIDNFMPRQLMKRGHRLVFSNGILVLAGGAVVLILATAAEVTRLIPLYAVGVFTSFTLSQASMARRHVRLKEPKWRKGLLINGGGAVLTLVVDIVIAATKFMQGAWVIIGSIPLLVLLLLRLNRQYVTEDAELESDAHLAATAPILRRHVVLVLIDRLDMAAARAIQYSRTLMPDELRAVHFSVDQQRAEALAAQWQRLGLARVPLDLRACPDRALTRAAIQLVAEELADGETEVSVLLPTRKYKGLWHRVLHDQTADAISTEVSRLPHANVTLVPFHLGASPGPRAHEQVFGARPPAESKAEREMVDLAAAERLRAEFEPRADGTVPIGSIRFRERARVRGRVTSLRIQSLALTPTLECILSDDSGQVSVVFLGRREVAGVGVGRTMTVDGVLGEHKGRLGFLNPHYELEHG